MASLLDICTRALDDISSFNVPTFFIGSTDGTAKTLVAAARKVGEEMVRDYNWQEMSRTATVATVDTVSLYDLEADYDRIESDTMYNSSAARPMWGNTTKREWSAVTNLVGVTDINYRWRLYRNQIQLEPAADGVFTFDYEYLSKAYCTDSVGVDRVDGWVADTDLPSLPADLFIAGTRYYFAKAKGLANIASSAGAEYDAIIDSRTSKNTPSQAVNMAAGVRTPSTYGYSFRRNFPDRVDI